MLPIDPNLLIAGVGLAAYAGIRLLQAGRRRTQQSDSYGAARWATQKELRALTVPSDSKPQPGAWMLGPSPFSKRERVELPFVHLCAHLLIVGPTRVGKTAGGVLPNLANFIVGSFITSDPKSEAFNKTSGYHKNVIRYAPREPGASACYNFIPPCKDSWHFALVIGRAIAEAEGKAEKAVWRDAQASLLAGVFSHVAHSAEPTPASAYDFLTHPKNQGTKWIKALLASPSVNARRVGASFGSASAELRGNILMPAANTLSWLADDEVRRFTSASILPPDFASIRTSATAMYWCLETKDIEALRLLSTIFWTHVFFELESTTGGLPVVLVLDELGNLGKIAGFEKKITIVGGLGIAVVMSLQALSQLTDTYGPAAADTILGNAGTLVVLAGLKPKTAEPLSQALGSRTIVKQQTSSSYGSSNHGGSSNTTESEHEHGKRLLFADDIRCLEQNEQLVISRNLRPFKQRRFWWTDAGRRARVNGLGSALTAYPLDVDETVIEDVSEEEEQEFPSPPV